LREDLLIHVSPSPDEYVGRSPEGMRAGLGAARRSARALAMAAVMITE